MKWSDFLEDILERYGTSEIVQNVGISQPTISRWMNGGEPNARAVIELCRYCNISPIEGLLAAGFISENDIKSTFKNVGNVNISRFSFDQLQREISRRYKDAAKIAERYDMENIKERGKEIERRLRR